MIYLASPYTHPDHSIRVRRYQAALEATIALCRMGHFIFSPIVYCHQLHEAGMGGDWSTWAEFDKDIIRRAAAMWVLTIDGWRESKGVQAEIDFASEIGKPMRALTLEEALTGGGS